MRLIPWLLLVIFLMSGLQSARAASQTKPHVASSPYDLINAVNALRTSHGQPPYSISSVLMSTAQAHADYMAATGNVSHTGLGGSSVTERLLAAGYPLAGDLSLGGFRSENITSGNESKTAQDAVNGWSGDTLHLTTMISPSLTEIGAGVSVNGGRVYFVIDCALPTTNGLPQPAAETAVVAASTVVPPGGVIIPVIVVTPDANGDLIHEVKAGQTLWQIAISYETKIDEIKRLNNLLTNDIYPGDRLLIRKGRADSTGTAPVSPTIEVTTTVTSMPTAIVTIQLPTGTAVAATPPLTISTNRVMSVAIAIVTIALLAAIYFIGMSEPKQSKLNSKR